MAQYNGKNWDEVIREHQKWAASDGQYGERAIFDDSDLYHESESFYKLNMRGASFRNARLHVDMTHAYFQDADFSGASLYGVDCRTSLFTNATFIGADLSYALFTDCDLSGANLCEARLIFTDFRGSNLNGALYNNRTRFPDSGFNVSSVMKKLG